MKQALVTATLAGCVLAGCGGRHAPPEAERAPARLDWRALATPADRNRLRQWRTVWLDAVGRARASGAARAIAAQGPLFDPDVSLGQSVPPPGEYRCRMFRAGAKGPGMQDFVALPVQPCRIEDEGGTVTFRMTGGGQRSQGRLFADPSGRAVFLGTAMVGDETRPIRYGRDTTRDLAGFMDRIGTRRWRMALPLPAFGATLDTIELVPAR